MFDVIDCCKTKHLGKPEERVKKSCRRFELYRADCGWMKKRKNGMYKKERVQTRSTWNTVRHDCPKLLNVPRDSSFLKRPPKICIPKSAKMKIKRIRRTSRALMDAMELTKLLTRFPIDAQYLQ